MLKHLSTASINLRGLEGIVTSFAWRLKLEDFFWQALFSAAQWAKSRNGARFPFQHKIVFENTAPLARLDIVLHCATIEFPSSISNSRRNPLSILTTAFVAESLPIVREESQNENFARIPSD